MKINVKEAINEIFHQGNCPKGNECDNVHCYRGHLLVLNFLLNDKMTASFFNDNFCP